MGVFLGGGGSARTFCLSPANLSNTPRVFPGATQCSKSSRISLCARTIHLKSTCSFTFTDPWVELMFS